MSNFKVEKDADKKIFWPDAGYTKQDLLDYYDVISAWILPYLKNRPVVIKRFPNGILGESSFQKNMKSAPSYVEIKEVPTKDHNKIMRSVICNDLETLHYLAHLATIELHPWGSKIGNLDNPDWMIFDLDPAPENSFYDIVQVALVLHSILDEKGLPNFCKTSGKRGLHINVPLKADESFNEVRAWANEIAGLAHKQAPELISMSYKPEERVGKIHIDTLRNAYGQTAVAPYSLRAVPGAHVSMPISWEDVDKDLNPADYNIKTVPEILKKHGDAWGLIKD